MTLTITLTDIIRHVQDNARYYYGDIEGQRYSVTYDTEHYWADSPKELVMLICEQEGIPAA